MAVKVIGKVTGFSNNSEIKAVNNQNNQNEEKPVIKEIQKNGSSKRESNFVSAEKKKALQNDGNNNNCNKSTYVNLNEVQNKGDDIYLKRSSTIPNLSSELNNVQEKKGASRQANARKEADEEKEDTTQTENKEIAFFTEPKTIKRKTQRHIFGFQAITAAAVCLIMLFFHWFAPELYDNLHLYFVKLFTF